MISETHERFMQEKQSVEEFLQQSANAYFFGYNYDKPLNFPKVMAIITARHDHKPLQ